MHGANLPPGAIWRSIHVSGVRWSVCVRASVRACVRTGMRVCLAVKLTPASLDRGGTDDAMMRLMTGDETPIILQVWDWSE